MGYILDGDISGIQNGILNGISLGSWILIAGPPVLSLFINPINKSYSML